MPKARPGKPRRKDETAATLGYEAQLWQMADALRGSMDAAEYRHVVLGLIFLGKILPAGFVPDEDKGYFFIQVQLPEAASQQRTDEVGQHQ